MTLDEIGYEPWEWQYNITNLYPFSRRVTVAASHELFVTWYHGPQDVAPGDTLNVTVLFAVPTQRVVPQKFKALISIAEEASGADSTVQYEQWVTVYVLPEPVLESKGQRRGPYNNCRMIHNQHKSFEGRLNVIGDLRPPLFQGITWSTSPSMHVVQGTTRQTRMTIPKSYWRSNDVLELFAVISFALPSDEDTVIDVHRKCVVRLNFGPNGAASTLKVRSRSSPDLLGDGQALQPLHPYTVDIAGWTHHSDIYYSVWCYWESDADSAFRLSTESKSTVHTIKTPQRPDQATLVLTVRATDEWEHPHKECEGCHIASALAPLPLAEGLAYIDSLLVAPWDSVHFVIDFLAVIFDGEEVDRQRHETFLDKALAVAQRDVGLFVTQTSHSFWAHLNLRTRVTDYDLKVTRLFDALATGGTTISETALTSISWIYGSVMRRFAAPTAKGAQSIWDALGDATIPPTSKFATLMDREAGLPPTGPARSASDWAEPPSARSVKMQVEVDLTAMIRNLYQRLIALAAIRDVDCLQSDPHLYPAEDRCFTVCALTAYRDELGSNFSRVVADDPLPYGGDALLQFAVTNRAWFDRIGGDLPEFATLVSLRLGKDCHFHAPRQHLSHVLWRVSVVDTVTAEDLGLPVSRGNYQVTVPIPSDPGLQDCMVKSSMAPVPDGVGREGYRSIPRSPLNGYCMTDELGWVTVTDPRQFPAASSDGIPLLALLVLTALAPFVCFGLWQFCRQTKSRRDIDGKLNPQSPEGPSTKADRPADLVRSLLGDPSQLAIDWVRRLAIEWRQPHPEKCRPIEPIPEPDPGPSHALSHSDNESDQHSAPQSSNSNSARMREAVHLSPPFEVAPQPKPAQPLATPEFLSPFHSWLEPKGSTSNPLEALPRQPSFRGDDVVLEVVPVGADPDMMLEALPVVIPKGHIVGPDGLGRGESLILKRPDEPVDWMDHQRDGHPDGVEMMDDLRKKDDIIRLEVVPVVSPEGHIVGPDGLGRGESLILERPDEPVDWMDHQRDRDPDGVEMMDDLRKKDDIIRLEVVPVVGSEGHIVGPDGLGRGESLIIERPDEPVDWMDHQRDRDPDGVEMMDDLRKKDDIIRLEVVPVVSPERHIVGPDGLGRGESLIIERPDEPVDWMDHQRDRDPDGVEMMDDLRKKDDIIRLEVVPVVSPERHIVGPDGLGRGESLIIERPDEPVDWMDAVRGTDPNGVEMMDDLRKKPDVITPEGMPVIIPGGHIMGADGLGRGSSLVHERPDEPVHWMDHRDRVAPDGVEMMDDPQKRRNPPGKGAKDAVILEVLPVLDPAIRDCGPEGAAAVRPPDDDSVEWMGDMHRPYANGVELMDGPGKRKPPGPPDEAAGSGITLEVVPVLEPSAKRARDRDGGPAFRSPDDDPEWMDGDMCRRHPDGVEIMDGIKQRMPRGTPPEAADGDILFLEAVPVLETRGRKPVLDGDGGAAAGRPDVPVEWMDDVCGQYPDRVEMLDDIRKRRTPSGTPMKVAQESALALDRVPVMGPPAQRDGGPAFRGPDDDPEWMDGDMRRRHPDGVEIMDGVRGYPDVPGPVGPEWARGRAAWRPVCADPSQRGSSDEVNWMDGAGQGAPGSAVLMDADRRPRRPLQSAGRWKPEDDGADPRADADEGQPLGPPPPGGPQRPRRGDPDYWMDGWNNAVPNAIFLDPLKRGSDHPDYGESPRDHRVPVTGRPVSPADAPPAQPLPVVGRPVPASGPVKRASDDDDPDTVWMDGVAFDAAAPGVAHMLDDYGRTVLPRHGPAGPPPPPHSPRDCGDHPAARRPATGRPPLSGGLRRQNTDDPVNWMDRPGGLAYPAEAEFMDGVGGARGPGSDLASLDALSRMASEVSLPDVPEPGRRGWRAVLSWPLRKMFGAEAADEGSPAEALEFGRPRRPDAMRSPDNSPRTRTVSSPLSRLSSSHSPPGSRPRGTPRDALPRGDDVCWMDQYGAHGPCVPATMLSAVGRGTPVPGLLVDAPLNPLSGSPERLRGARLTGNQSPPRGVRRSPWSRAASRNQSPALSAVGGRASPFDENVEWMDGCRQVTLGNVTMLSHIRDRGGLGPSRHQSPLGQGPGLPRWLELPRAPLDGAGTPWRSRSPNLGQEEYEEGHACNVSMQSLRSLNAKAAAALDNQPPGKWSRGPDDAIMLSKIRPRNGADLLPEEMTLDGIKAQRESPPGRLSKLRSRLRSRSPALSVESNSSSPLAAGAPSRPRSPTPTPVGVHVPAPQDGSPSNAQGLSASWRPRDPSPVSFPRMGSRSVMRQDEHREVPTASPVGAVEELVRAARASDSEGGTPVPELAIPEQSAADPRTPPVPEEQREAAAAAAEPSISKPSKIKKLKAAVHRWFRTGAAK